MRKTKIKINCGEKKRLFFNPHRLSKRDISNLAYYKTAYFISILMTFGKIPCDIFWMIAKENRLKMNYIRKSGLFSGLLSTCTQDQWNFCESLTFGILSYIVLTQILSRVCLWRVRRGRVGSDGWGMGGWGCMLFQKSSHDKIQVISLEIQFPHCCTVETVIFLFVFDG